MRLQEKTLHIYLAAEYMPYGNHSVGERSTALAAEGEWIVMEEHMQPAQDIQAVKGTQAVKDTQAVQGIQVAKGTPAVKGTQAAWDILQSVYECPVKDL